MPVLRYPISDIELQKLLPGATYMDPPDGGSVTLIEQLQRMAKDAERYRFLRADFSPMGLDAGGQHAWAYRRNATLKGPTLDAAIDAALASK